MLLLVLLCLLRPSSTLLHAASMLRQHPNTVPHVLCGQLMRAAEWLLLESPPLQDDVVRRLALVIIVVGSCCLLLLVAVMCCCCCCGCCRYCPAVLCRTAPITTCLLFWNSLPESSNSDPSTHVTAPVDNGRSLVGRTHPPVAAANGFQWPLQMDDNYFYYYYYYYYYYYDCYYYYYTRNDNGQWQSSGYPRWHHVQPARRPTLLG